MVLIKNEMTKYKYPIFLDCKNFTIDTFWLQIFDDCSKGKFPKGSGIDSKGINIYFKNSKKYISYKIKSNPEQIYKDLKKLFLEQLNIKSQKDREIIKNEINDICQDYHENCNDKWNQIRKKKVKDPIIRRYILDLKKEYNLENKETLHLSQIIKLGFLFNWITNDKVVYEDQRILDITSLQYIEEDNIFELTEPDVDYKREFKIKKIKLYNFWDKFVNKNEVDIEA